MTQVDSQHVTVDGGASTTITLSWQTSSSDPDDTGAYEATAASPSSSDSQLVTVGSRELSRFVTGWGAPGAGSVSRSTTSTRSVTATSPGGAGRVTRTATMERSLTGWGSGAGAVAWTAPEAWALPTAPTAGRRFLVSPDGIETDHDRLSLSTEFSASLVEELDHYQRAGDVDREESAFGTFRRIPRDGSEPVTIIPPTELSPPFDTRRVVPTGTTIEEAAPRRYAVSFDLGLEEPRPRDPLQGSGETIRADTESVTVDDTGTVTLSWTPDGSQLGDWVATATAGDSSDSQLVTVSDAPWTLSWPVATLALTESQVGQIERDQSGSVPTVSLPLRLDAEQVAILLAVGSRVEATEVRAVPDGTNVAVDTLPGDELSVNIAPPPDADVDDGAYILQSWSVSRSRAGRRPFVADLTLVSD